MAPHTGTSRQQLLNSLQSHSLSISNLQALLGHWPQYVNLELEHLQKDVDERLQRCVIYLRLRPEMLPIDSFIANPFS